MYRGKTIALTAMARNEERLIRPTLESIPDFVDRVYFVDDGSTDSTLSIAREIATRDPRIEVIEHESNLGVGQSIITGYEHSTADGNDITVVVAGDNPLEVSANRLGRRRSHLVDSAEPLHQCHLYGKSGRCRASSVASGEGKSSGRCQLDGLKDHDDLFLHDVPHVPLGDEAAFDGDPADP